MRHWKARDTAGAASGAWDFPGGFGRHGFEDDDKLAQALGISVEALRKAKDAAFASAVQEAVDEGELAPKQAQRMLAWRALRKVINLQALAAQVIEMTPAELQAALDQGQSPWDLLAAKGLDPRTAVPAPAGGG